MQGRMDVAVGADLPVLRDGLCALIARERRLRLAGSAASAVELDALIGRRPAVAAVDVAMRDLRVPALAERARAHGTRLVLLAGECPPAVVHDALAAGADGFASLRLDAHELAAVLVRVGAGERIVSPEHQSALIGELQARRASPPAALTIGCATVRTHLERMYDKLGACDRASLVAAAMRIGELE
jgi:two-component system nitrate/nitrite response regulator NarL